MDKERVKKGLINAAPYLTSAAVQIPILATGGNWFNGVLFLASAGVGYIGYKAGLAAYDREQVEKSPIYQEYLGLYNEFVKDIAKMYKELGIDSGVQSAVIYKMCLERGIFSHDRTDRYTVYENDKDVFLPTLGARVATGKYCCRHNASLYSDIVNEMGDYSPKISVYTGDKSNKRLLLRPNHLISGLVYKDKKLVFDPTPPLMLMISNGFGFFKGEKTLYRDVCENDFGVKYTFVSTRYDNGVSQDDSFEQFMRRESMTDSTDLLNDFLEALFLGTTNLKDFEDFHEEEKPKILQLAHLNNIVVSRGKEVSKKD